MPDVQMLEVKQERFRLAQEKKANDARLVESASEADADKEADAREVCLNSGIWNRLAINPTNTAVEAHDETGARSRASSGDEDAMTSRMRSTDGGVWLASVKQHMVLENCSVNPADGGAQSESIPVNDEVNCAAVSAAEDVKMVLSDLAVDQTGNSPPEDLLLEDHVSEDHRQQNAGGEWDDKLSLNASEFMEKVAVNATRASLPQVHPFFSATVPQDDIEVLTRASSTEVRDSGLLFLNTSLCIRSS
uniref:Uncharacterized protein n=1 Tax=Hyaloperonospora arabidopsidis (strain Emoy2) TaxID=559515 RepID=M4BL25_HYAAE